jgi:hypothetical protein
MAKKQESGLMQMVEPDYWKGRGRYSKQAVSRKVKDDTAPYVPETVEETQEAK